MVAAAPGRSCRKDLGEAKMPTTASTMKIALGAAFVAALSLHAQAAPAEPETAPEGQAPTAPQQGLECAAEPLTGSGSGFKSSQDESEEAAKTDWLAKAKAVYADATWEAAKEPFMQCVKQGLYSKCFATGRPCRPKPE
jgi:hypothetical protein